MPCNMKHHGSRKRHKRIVREVKRRVSSISRIAGGKGVKRGKR